MNIRKRVFRIINEIWPTLFGATLGFYIALKTPVWLGVLIILGLLVSLFFLIDDEPDGTNSNS